MINSATASTIAAARWRQIATSYFVTLTRTGQFLAAAALTACLAFAASPPAHAEWDIGAYDACLARKGIPAGQEDYSGECCSESGGNWSLQQVKCTAPPPIEESLPPQPQKPQIPVNPVPPGGIQAPPAPPNPTAPMNPGIFG